MDRDLLEKNGFRMLELRCAGGVFKNWQLSGGGIRTNWIGPQVLNRMSRVGSIARLHKIADRTVNAPYWDMFKEKLHKVTCYM
jgi:hypothetical protein